MIAVCTLRTWNFSLRHIKLTEFDLYEPPCNWKIIRKFKLICGIIFILMIFWCDENDHLHSPVGKGGGGSAKNKRCNRKLHWSQISFSNLINVWFHSHNTRCMGIDSHTPINTDDDGAVVTYHAFELIDLRKK